MTCERGAVAIIRHERVRLVAALAALDGAPGGVGVARGQVPDGPVPPDRDAPARRRRHAVLVDQHDVEVGEPLPDPADVLLRLLVGGDEGREGTVEQRVQLVIGPGTGVGALRGQLHPAFVPRAGPPGTALIRPAKPGWAGRDASARLMRLTAPPVRAK
jgi:hypothetical protein